MRARASVILLTVKAAEAARRYTSTPTLIRQDVGLAMRLTRVRPAKRKGCSQGHSRNHCLRMYRADGRTSGGNTGFKPAFKFHTVQIMALPLLFSVAHAAAAATMEPVTVLCSGTVRFSVLTPRVIRAEVIYTFPAKGTTSVICSCSRD